LRGDKPMPLAKTGSRAKFRHKRIASPKAFDSRSFRTKKVGKSRVIIGCPTGKYSPSTGRCKVGTKAQAVLRPKKQNPKVISKEEYKRLKKHGHIHKMDSKLYMLTMVKGATKLVPVEVEKTPRATTSGRKKNPIGARNRRNKPGDSIDWQKWATKHEKELRKTIEYYIGQGIGKKRAVEMALEASTVGKGYKDRIRKGYGANPRKKWYYGPSITHRGKVLVFPSSKAPTKATHGRKVKYAVGPFKTPDEASKKARYAKMGMTGR